MTAANGYSPCDFADCAKVMQRRIIVKSGTAVPREVAVFESNLPFPPVIGVGYCDNRDPCHKSISKQLKSAMRHAR
jgi:hypothetical protein